MRWWNRTKLLWAYLWKKSKVNALPVEYIVETTAKCNLYCPMCPRETHKQPKEDMESAAFDRLMSGTQKTAEHMMLIGLGEPLLDVKIFDRIQACQDHGISSLISTNGTLLDEQAALKLLRTPLKHITLSFDGSTKESFEFYRKGAKFERVQENFVRFAQLKQQHRPDITVVVQMVRMEKNWHEVDAFERFWRAVPGVDEVRVKADETNLMIPDGHHTGESWKHPCHYLWRGPAYVKHNGDVYPCCQSYMLDGQPIGSIHRSTLPEIFDGPSMRHLREMHAQGRAGHVEMCAKCCTAIPHPLLVCGSLLLHGDRVRKLIPAIERAIYFSRLPGQWLRPQKQAETKKSDDLVQIR
jgi:radical SAM protein with 4Fe4S-binding SPASM domain